MQHWATYRVDSGYNFVEISIRISMSEDNDSKCISCAPKSRESDKGSKSIYIENTFFYKAFVIQTILLLAILSAFITYEVIDRSLRQSTSMHRESCGKTDQCIQIVQRLEKQIEDEMLRNETFHAITVKQYAAAELKLTQIKGDMKLSKK